MSATSTPLVSIVMPAFNSEATISEALESIQSQTYPHWELVVVDDGSNDKTVSIVEAARSSDSRIQLIKMSENSGKASVPRNRGLDQVRGEFVAFLDSDDSWAAEKLEKQVGFMLASQIDASFHSYTRFHPPSGKRFLQMAPVKVSYREALYTNPIACSTVMVRKKILHELRFNTQLELHEDYLMWLDVLKKTEFFYGFRECLAEYRLGSQSFSSNKLRAARQQWQIYRNYENIWYPMSLIYFSSYMVNGLLKHYFKK